MVVETVPWRRRSARWHDGASAVGCSGWWVRKMLGKVFLISKRYERAVEVSQRQGHLTSAGILGCIRKA